MTGPFPPRPARPTPPSNSPFGVNRPIPPVSYMPEQGPGKDPSDFRPLRMLALVGIGAAILGAIVLFITVFLAPPTPGGDNANGTLNPGGTTEPIAEGEVGELITLGANRFTEAVTASGGVKVGITSNLLYPNDGAPLQVDFDAQGNHIVYSLDLGVEPTPVRFTRDGITYINTVTPYPASTDPVARIRDSEYVGEWAMADTDDPTGQIPTLPEFASIIAPKMTNTRIGGTTQGGATQVIGDLPAVTAAEIPAGMLSEDIPEGAQAAFLFDDQERLVGVSLTSPASREGELTAPQVTYAVPLEGFASVVIPDKPSDPGVAPVNLPTTGPWSSLVSLATEIQKAAREAAQRFATDEPITQYTPDVAGAVQQSVLLSERISATGSTFDPLTSTLKDSSGRVVCLPIGTISSDTDVANMKPTLYLDLCPTAPQANISE